MPPEPSPPSTPEPPFVTIAEAFGPRRTPPPTRRREVLYHLAGVVVTAIAGLVAFWAVAILSFVTSTCSEDATVPDRVHDLQFGLVVIAVCLAAVPAMWAQFARKPGYTSWPWLALAGVVLAGGVLLAASTREVATFCLY